MVALASPKRKSAVDVQESELPEVAFYAKMIGNGRVYVQIRKKESKDTFAVWVSGEKVSPIDQKISRKILRRALKTGELCPQVKIKITKETTEFIQEILDAI